MLDSTSTYFYACKGYERCQSSLDQCDCLGGLHNLTDDTTIVSSPMRCANGYQDGSPLCSMCDADAGYARTLGQCKKCDWSSGSYLILTVLVVLVWFPVTATLTAHFESLEITFAFVQFLGLYSNYQVEWRPGLQSIFGNLAFFNLDFDMMHLSCYNNMGYTTLWTLQTFLPIFYPILCSLHFGLSWLLMQLAKRGLPPSRTMLKLGWRPRRSWTLSAVRDSYLPSGLLYMHVYYITGISKALEVLMCEGGEGGSKAYLAANPEMTCWEGAHMALVGADVIAVFFYFVLVPAGYVYVLFRLVGPGRLSDPRLVHNFGFIWGRFTAAHYAWELVDMIRKIGLVLIMLAVKEPFTQSILGVVCVGVVQLGVFASQPFWRREYNIYEMLGTTSEALVLLLGILVLYRSRLEVQVAAGDVPEGAVSVYNALEPVVYVLIIAMLIGCVITFYLDMEFVSFKRRWERARHASGMALKDEVWRITPSDTVVLEYIESATDQQKRRLKALEKALMRAEKTYSNEAAKTKRDVYEAQLKAEPKLMGWLADMRVNTTDVMPSYVTHLMDEAAAEAHPVTATEIIDEQRRAAIALWLSEGATDPERRLVDEVVNEINDYREGHVLLRPLLTRLIRDPVAKMLSKFKITPAQRKTDKMAANAYAVKEAAADVKGPEQEAMKALDRSKSKLGKWALSVKKLGTNKDLKTDLLRQNAIEQMLSKLLEELNCETVVLVPIKTDEYKPLPRLVLLSEDHFMKGAMEMEKMKIERTTDWECSNKRSPAGRCLSTGEPLVIANLLLDRRFDTRGSGFEGISQLCIPILAGASATEDSEAEKKKEPAIIGVIKCLNKVSYSGGAAGVPFKEPVDVETAVNAAQLLFETSETFAANEKAMGVLSALAKSSLAAKMKRGGEPIMGTLKIQLNSCKALKAVNDEVGDTPDPYVEFELSGQSQKSRVVKKTLDPVFNQSFSFMGDLNKFTKTSLKIKVTDWDRFSANDPMGSAEVDLSSLNQSAKQDLNVPLSMNGKEQGTVSLSLEWQSKEAGGSFVKKPTAKVAPEPESLPLAEKGEA